MGILTLLLIVQIVALSPAQLEETSIDLHLETPLKLLLDRETTLAPGIPKTAPPDYTIEKFSYVSVYSGERQWKLDAERAFLFNHTKLVHARRVTAYLFDSAGKPTIISGREAKYFLNQRDLELFGDVETEFPDGFHTKSEYLRYLPNEKKIIIPTHYRVLGGGEPSEVEEASNRTLLEFESNGLFFEMDKSLIVLPENVQVIATRGGEKTLVESDQCSIHRDQNRAHFEMKSSRPPAERFVRIKQPTLFVRSRTADLNYGNTSDTIRYLVAYDDVYIRQTGDQTLKYATSSRADFDNEKNLIVLTGFPQVYQDKDTVTGDVIILHRDTDIVEVEQSNAFSEGSPSQRKKP